MTELSTENVLHPRQVTELKEAKAGLAEMLNAPPYIRNQLVDGGAGVQKQMRDVDNMLKQAAVPIPPDQIDAAVKAEKVLREAWGGSDMPTDTEMRRNSPGCVDKNMAWSKKHKTEVAQWKNLRRRLHASGISEHRLSNEGDVSNIEMYRPHGGSGELSMDNAQIAGKDWRLPPPGAGPVAIMTDEDAEVLGEINPDLMKAMGTLSNEQRGEVLEMVRTIASLEEKPKAIIAGATVGKSDEKRPGKKWSPERRKEASERYHAGQQAKEAETAKRQVFTGE